MALRPLCAAWGVLLSLVACHTDPSLPAKPHSSTYTTVSTFADGSTGSNPASGSLTAIAVGAQRDVYVTDTYSNLIRKVSSTGSWSVLAGGGTGGSFADGTGDAARFNRPQGIAVDGQGNVYVGDTYNHRIRRITPAGVVTTFAGTGQAGYADGPGTSAQFYTPFGVTVDGQGNVFVADYSNERIRKITPNGLVSTVAGSGSRGFLDGRSEVAQFHAPIDVAVDGQGNLYVAELGNSAIRKITAAGAVSTLAGTGIGSPAVFDAPRGLDVDVEGTVYVADSDNRRIRRVSSTGVVSTLAGSSEGGSMAAGYQDGPLLTARFRYPYGIAFDASGSLYISDAVWVRTILAK
jgi:sugar lactone lactonase YvrE